METQGPFRRESVFRLNERLDRLAVPWDANETVIEEMLDDLDRSGCRRDPAYWLLTARLTELAVICAGNYADQCEFTAAGDLMFNPRKVLIHQKGRVRPLVKHRHGRLSDQMRLAGETTGEFACRLRQSAFVEIVQPALLPELLDRISGSVFPVPVYIESVQRRMEKAASLIGFLLAGSVFTAADLYHRMNAGSGADRAMYGAHLCRFETDGFRRMGQDIRRMISERFRHSPFLEDVA